MWVEKNGKTWRVRDLAAGRKVTVGHGYPTKTSAKAAMTTLRADQLRGDALVPQGGRVRLKAFVEAWWPAYAASLKASSRTSEETRARLHILDLLGEHSLDELCAPLAIQRWLGQLSAGRPGRRPLSPKSVRNCHGLLHKILGVAVAQKLIRFNPCAESSEYLPEWDRHEMRFLTEPEVGRLIAATPEHWRPLVLLLVATGLRWGEAAALRVRSVDVLAGQLTVTRTQFETNSAEIVYTKPKTKASRRTVTFTPEVGDALAPAVSGRDRDELVFRSPQGQVVRRRNFYRGWSRWTEAAGLGKVRVHDLRHTHAAHLISRGIPLTAIQRRLGHASITVTSDLYGHLLPEVDASIRLAVGASLAHVGADPIPLPVP